MQLLLTAAFFLAFTYLMAWGQGWLMPALRLTPDNTRASDRQKFALHWILGAVWFLPVLPFVFYFRSWEPLAIAGLVRFILFDPVLNYHEGNPETPVFAVGESANTDKLIRWLAGIFGRSPSVVSAILRIAGILLLGVGVLVFC